MEEQVGELWHKLITRLADNRNPQAAVKLKSMNKSLGIYFRALGGDAGLKIEAADATANPFSRSRLQRFAGTNSKIYMTWRDDRALRLPPNLAWFDRLEHNRELYFWLTALGACAGEDTSTSSVGEWIRKNQRLTQKVLKRFPGMKRKYQNLVRLYLLQRSDCGPADSKKFRLEHAIELALVDPDDDVSPPESKLSPGMVPLWLHPFPPGLKQKTAAKNKQDNQQQNHSKQQRELEDMGRRQAEQVDDPEENRGLVTVRMENIFSMGEFVNVDRGTEEEENLDRAEDVARDLDKLSVSRDNKTARATLKFDLDLPSESEEDRILDNGILLPEWDWKQRQLLPNRCRVVVMQADRVSPSELPAHLTRSARKLRNHFQALAPARVWHRAQAEGQDIDLDAYLQYGAEREAGNEVSSGNLYRDLRSGNRDLSCLLLADLSLSTDAYIDNHHRVIDVIRDSLYLFGECLKATGDRFALYGFSTRKRDPIRVHQIKTFDQTYDALTRSRIGTIKPGYYTRLGAGIRFAAQELMRQGNGKRLLLVLTDGKPNDLDQYEGRYGIEDTRQAIIAARQAGLLPFCVTIDKKGNDYLPYLFGKGDYVVIRDPKRLPHELPRLYALLTQ